MSLVRGWWKCGSPLRGHSGERANKAGANRVCRWISCCTRRHQVCRLAGWRCCCCGLSRLARWFEFINWVQAATMRPALVFFTACWPRVCAAAQSHELIKRTAAAAATAESGCAERAKSLACMSVSFQLSGPQNSTSVKQTLTMGL